MTFGGQKMENILQFVILGLFLIAFASIIFEEHIGYEKYKTSMFFGTIAWILILINGSINGKNDFMKVEHAFHEYFLEIAMLWLFLISAMTFVAYLDKRGFIEKSVVKALPESLSEKKFLFIIASFTFLFSGIADNLTATLVALSIVIAMMKNASSETLVRFGVMIIFAANAGGLPLITGDVTTLMIFVAGKINMIELLVLYIPAFVTTMVLYLYLAKPLNGNIFVKKENLAINPLDTKIAVLFIFTIIAILAGHVAFHLPPVLVFLTGLSLMFLLIAKDKKMTKSEIKALDYVEKVEFDALFFFLGVLLLVGALKEVGMLGKLAILYDLIPAEAATFAIGMLSAVVDNIPITAAMLKADLPIDDHGWMLMTYAVGIGGSLLVIGSAAGVVAMSKVKELSFGAYLKFTPVIFGVYSLGFGITYIVAHFVV
jgi:Na+/H+ antiporter NhaD/arsenite permease-like protein